MSFKLVLIMYSSVQNVSISDCVLSEYFAVGNNKLKVLHFKIDQLVETLTSECWPQG